MIGKNLFVKTNVTSNVDPVGNRVKAPVSIVNRTITKKDTRRRPKVHFVTIIRAKVGKTLTSKDSKKRVIWFAVKKMFKGRFVGRDTRGKPINKVYSGFKSKLPKT